MPNLFNVFPRLRSSDPGVTITYDDLITRFKTPNPRAMEASKLLKESTQYKSIKEVNIEAFRPNFYSPQNVRRRDDGLVEEPTGYIYLDFDNVGSEEEVRAFREELIKYPFIALCWLSLSRKGLGALVSVDQNDEYLHELYWKELKAIFHNNSNLDKRAEAYSKLCCIPFDDSIYISKNPISFHFKPNLGAIKLDKQGGQQVTYLKGKGNRELLDPHPLSLNSVLWKTQIPEEKFEDVNLPYIALEGEDYIEIDFGKLYTHKIRLGERNPRLGAISMQFIYLNYGRVKESQILNALLSINRHCTEVPLEEYEVRSIFEANYTKHEKEGLDVSKYFNREKKVFWHPDCKLSGNERRSIGQTLLLKSRGKGKEYTEQLIYDAIEDLMDGVNPIRNERLMEYTGIKRSTFKTYKKPFTSIIEDYNRSLVEMEIQAAGAFVT